MRLRYGPDSDADGERVPPLLDREPVVRGVVADLRGTLQHMVGVGGSTDNSRQIITRRGSAR